MFQRVRPLPFGAVIGQEANLHGLEIKSRLFNVTGRLFDKGDGHLALATARYGLGMSGRRRTIRIAVQFVEEPETLVGFAGRLLATAGVFPTVVDFCQSS